MAKYEVLTVTGKTSSSPILRRFLLEDDTFVIYHRENAGELVSGALDWVLCVVFNDETFALRRHIFKISG